MIDPHLAVRLKSAWQALNEKDPAKAARVANLLNLGHAELLSELDLREPRMEAFVQPHHVPRELLFMKAVLEDQHGVLAAAAGKALAQQEQLAQGIAAKQPGPDGTLPGFAKFHHHDLGWLECGVIWLENMVAGLKFNFGTLQPSIIPIDNKVQIAMAADFGTGDWGSIFNPAASTKIRGHIVRMKPEITIHLGDVYYAGTQSSEAGNLTSVWPAGGWGSFALNSNHEMYPGGIAYYNEALGAPLFQKQQKRSCFVLENDNWIIVGLDSAYFSDEETFYMFGDLGPSDGIQAKMLADLAKKQKRMLILSHHNGLELDGSVPSREAWPDGLGSKLWYEIQESLQSNDKPVYWYWGHQHAGVVYKHSESANLFCRCIGHGALPYGNASVLDNSPNVIWHERTPANDPHDPERLLNGFAVLDLNAAQITETFYNENSAIAWQSS